MTPLIRSIRDQSQRANRPPKLEHYRQTQRITVSWSRGAEAETSTGVKTRFLLPSASYPAFSKKLQDILKDTTHNLKRQSKYQHQTQIWQMLELSDWEFKTAMINRLKILIQKVDNMQEEMGNINREMETLRTKRKA